VYKYSDPPIVFRDVNGEQALKTLTDLVHDFLRPDQQAQLKDWHEYLSTDNGAWVLGEEHIDLVAYLLTEGEGKFPPNVPLLMLQALQAAALQEDFVLVLHCDRKDRKLMSYVNKIESHTLAEQEEIAKLLCNLCSQPSSFDWLMYITEWTDVEGIPMNNARVTTRAAVHTLLNEELTTLQKTGVSLILNLSLKELFDDIATELATAVLQFMHSDLPEDQAFDCLTALIRFADISTNEVPALAKMLGPDLKKFVGKSQRVDQLVSEAERKIEASIASQYSRQERLSAMSAD
jgi:hypothetical protein